MSKEIIKSAFINLSIEEQSKIIADLNTIHTDNLEKTVAGGLSQDQKTDIADTLQETPNILGSLLPINDSMLAVPGHTLDMEVEGKPIYDHLQIFKDKILQSYSNNEKFISLLPQLIETIKSIKIHFPEINPQEEEKNIKDKTIVRGEDIGNKSGGTTLTGVPDLIYQRGRGLSQNINSLIPEIRKMGLNAREAIALVALIAGLPKGGLITNQGFYQQVGETGYYTLGSVPGGFVDGIAFNEVFIGSFREAGDNARSDAMPALTR